MTSPLERNRGDLPELGAAVWAQVQAVLATAGRDVEASSQTLQRMLAELDPSAGPDPRLAHALVLRGVSRLELLFRERPEQAVVPAREAVDLLASLDDSPAIRERRVGAFGDLSNALMSAGRHAEAIEAARAGLEAARGCNDGMTVIRALVRIGGQQAAMNRREEADASHAEALALARTMDDPEAMGLARMGLGLRARERGAIDEAVEHLGAALREFEAAGSVGDRMAVLQCLAAPDVARARPEVAREAGRKAEALRASAERTDERTATEQDAVDQARAGRWAEAQELWRRAPGGPADAFNRLNAAICAYQMGERIGLAAELAALFERLAAPPRHHAAVMAMMCRHADGMLPEAWRFAAALGRAGLLPWDLPTLPVAVTREYAIEASTTDPVVGVLEQLLATPGGSPDDRQCVESLIAGYAERRAADDGARSKGSWLGWLKRIASWKN